MLILTLIFSIMQQAKDNILAPKYFGSVIGIHPVLIFLALMIGARIDGMTGIVFSLPVACVIYVILKHLPLKSNQDYVKDSHSGIIPGYIQNKIDEEASQEKQD
jgi:predicted PurR-regulated permease PerM